MNSLTDEDIHHILTRALEDPERGYGKLKVELSPEAMAHLAHMAGGDARNALNALELAVETTVPDKDGVYPGWAGCRAGNPSKKRAVALRQKTTMRIYDYHLPLSSKSVRGSDPDAALYWLAKML